MSDWQDIVEALKKRKRSRPSTVDDGESTKRYQRLIDAAYQVEANYRYGTYSAAMAGDDPWLIDPRSRMRLDGKSKWSRPIDFVNRIGRLDSEELTDWQRRMFAAGLFGEDEPIYGYFDQATAGALQALSFEVIRQGNKVGPNGILEALSAAVDADGDGIPDDLAAARAQQAPPGNTMTVSNPLDLQETAQSVSGQLMGREVDEARAQELMGGYNEAELAPQRADIAIGEGTTDGVVTQAPSAEAFAEQQIREEYATEVDSFTALNAFNVIMQLIGEAG